MTPEHHPRPDRIARRVMHAVSALPGGAQKALGGKPTTVDGQQLHPEVQLALRLLNVAAGKTFEELPLAEGRAQLRSEAWVFGDAPDVATVRDLTIDGRGGPIRARLYADDLPPKAPLLVYFHGGGWVLGDLSAADAVCRFLALHAGVVVMSVDYRLAPEHPFPAGVEDAIDAFHYALEHAAEFGANPDAVAVGGESAGGNLAAVVAQDCAAKGGPVPAMQLLIFPVTDLTTKHRSYSLFSKGYFLTEAQMDWYRHHYLSDPAQASDPRVSPLLAPDLNGLPPAYVVTAGFDPLRDEGEAYAARMREAGVHVALRRHPGLIHGIVNATGVGHAAREVLFDIAGALRMHLASR